jgi:hypothetical protein
MGYQERTQKGYVTSEEPFFATLVKNPLRFLKKNSLAKKIIL